MQAPSAHALRAQECCEGLVQLGTPPVKRKAGELPSRLQNACANYVCNFIVHADSPSPKHPWGVELKQRLRALSEAHGEEYVVGLCAAWFVARAEDQFENGDDDE